MLKKTDFSSLEGKVVMITGGTSGFGLSMVKLFAANGAKVVFGARREALGIQIAQDLVAQGADVTFMRMDTSKEEDVKALVDLTVEKHGQLNVLVNNAGVIPSDGMHPTHDIKVSELRRLMEINVMGYFYGMKYGVAAMLKTKSRECSVINIASACGFRANEGFLPYDTTKHAIVGMTKTAALDYAKHDITVNCICPGAFKTGIHDGISEEQLKLLDAANPNGRAGRPDEVAYLALFLATDMARMINGSPILIDAGEWAGHVDVSGASVWSEPDPRM